MVASEGADNTVSDGVAEAKRVAERQYGIADLDIVELAERYRREILAVGLEHGKIGFRIVTAYGSAQAAAVGEYKLDVVGAFDHVIVGQDVTFAADDHART